MPDLTVQDYEANLARRYMEESLPTKREKWYTGNKLVERLKYIEKEQDYKKRYVFKDLMEYLVSNKTIDVCAIQGLRRTGKSVLMRQAMRELIDVYHVDPSEIAYITFPQETLSTDKHLLNDIRILVDKNVRYFFVDEISFLNMNLDCNVLNLLADEFTVGKYKIVVSGTFSYALRLLSCNTLYDRTIKIDTTYFSFKEAHEIFGYDIESFIKYGGLIGLKKGEEVNVQDYMKTAIYDNIVESLIKSDKLYEIELFDKELRELMSNEKTGAIKARLTTLIKRVIDQYLTVLMYNKVATKPYKFSDIGNLANIIRQRSLREPLSNGISPDVINLKTDKYYEMLEKELGSVSKSDISEVAFNEFISILKQINVIEDIYLQSKHESCFIPNFLRYGLCNEIVEKIAGEIEAETGGRYKADLAEEQVKGPIQEAIVYLDLKHSCKYNFDKYKNKDQIEVDLIIKHNDTKTMDIYEIKHSSLPLEIHARNLINKAFRIELEKEMGYQISSINVLYNGENITKEIDATQVFASMVDSANAIGKRDSANKWQGFLELASKDDNWMTIVNYKNLTEFLCEL